MKFIGRTVVLLLIVNILLVYMHYKQAGDVVAKEPKKLTYQQEIEVMNRADALYVRHHFSGLSEGRHEIVWPEASIERSCYPADTSSCERLDDNLTAFLDGSHEQQSISYKIPKNGPMGQAMLFKEPFAKLHGTSATSTLFHLTDEIGSGGMWVNGLKQVGTKKMDLIDYTFFRGSGEIKDLYWQENRLPLLYEGKQLAVYGAKGNAEQFDAVNEALGVIGADHSAIVIDHTNLAVHSQRFIVSENEDVEKVSNQFLTSAMSARFSIPPQQRLLAEIMASILGDKATGPKQSRLAYDKLTTALTPEELESLKELVTSKSGQEISAAILDDMIREVTGFKTAYFKTVMQKETAHHPFLFGDTREVTVDGVSQAHIDVIWKDGKTLYPAKAILSLTGYSVTTNERSIYIESANRQFRFPRKELFYVYNERKFDVMTTPFEVLAGDIYFEENRFKRLFLLTIDKTVDTIDIANLSTVLEGVEQ
ncbi:hypothetical protein [Sporosarcina sp. YIM B06819]|uniref:hypothetical protein n=1 Tax=Sporosarcina sp. YIM B06819 TaxID=3081769 RepID=UPI00298D0CDB|nr:hypothetical protein [Sporosarcina sp. YIM B06819]